MGFKDTKTIFEENGFYHPVDVVPAAEASRCCTALLDLKQPVEAGSPADPHLRMKLAYDLAVHPRMLDTAEALIGPDIMIWVTALFAKEPHVGREIPWHRDLPHLGPEARGYVTGWIALTPVTRANGCVRFLAGSHKSTDMDLAGIGRDAVPVELSPGQACFHHGHVLHGSSPSRSAAARIGLAVIYVTPENRGVAADRNFATLVRGVDRFGYFEQKPAPHALA